MSGGHFGYSGNAVLLEIAEEIDRIIDTNNSVKHNKYGDEEGHHFSDDIIVKLREASSTLRSAYNMVHCIDYLLSGDYGEESFNQEWKERCSTHN
jgi:hypothetical protein